MNIELKDKVSFNYIYLYIIILFELEIYLIECESFKEKSFKLLESYYKLLRTKDVLNSVELYSETNVDNRYYIYNRLM